MKINIAIITSDQSAHIVPATLYMYNKYLPNDIDYTIYVCGYKKPNIVETEKIKFIQMKERQEDINEWTTYVLSALQTIDSEYIILAVNVVLAVILLAVNVLLAVILLAVIVLDVICTCGYLFS